MRSALLLAALLPATLALAANAPSLPPGEDPEERMQRDHAHLPPGEGSGVTVRRSEGASDHRHNGHGSGQGHGNHGHGTVSPDPHPNPSPEGRGARTPEPDTAAGGRGAQPEGSGHAHGGPGTEPPRDPIPPLSDADRAAAFPPLNVGHQHGHSIHWYLLADRFEWQQGDRSDTLAWEIGGWVGTDIDRLWVRTEGERTGGRTGHADVHLLYGRALARWWDLVAGMRHDFGGGPERNWAAFGVQGLAPYLFEVEATVYLGESGRTAARLEAEYDLLLSNRLILQPLVELDFYGQDDPARGIGSGLSSAGLELRLRYEITRRIAPYIGLSRERLFGGTAQHALEHGEDPDDTRLVAGIRFWF